MSRQLNLPYFIEDQRENGMSWINILGFAAAFSVLSSFCMTTMVALRTFALLSNILFILYGFSAHIYPVFFLHVVLLPINLVKLHRILAESHFFYGLRLYPRWLRPPTSRVWPQ